MRDPYGGNTTLGRGERSKKNLFIERTDPERSPPPQHRQRGQMEALKPKDINEKKNVPGEEREHPVVTSNEKFFKTEPGKHRPHGKNALGQRKI